MFLKEPHQGQRLLGDAVQRVLDEFGGNETQTAFYTVVMAGNLFREPVDGRVHIECIAAFAGHSTFRRIPQCRIDRYFRSNLFGLGVDADFA